MADASGNSKKRHIDERLDALTMNLELMSLTTEENSRQVAALGNKFDQLAVSTANLVDPGDRGAIDIAALARIAESRVHRRENPEGGLG